MKTRSAPALPVHSFVVVEHGAALPASWLCPRADVVVLNELDSETPEAFAQRVVRSVSKLAQTSVIPEVRLFAARGGDDARLRARSTIARALLAAMRSAPAPRITFVAARDARAQHEWFALADTVRSEAHANVSVCLKLRGPSDELDEPVAVAS